MTLTFQTSHERRAGLWLRGLLFLCSVILASLLLLVPAAQAQTATPGSNLVVCGNSNWGGLNVARTQAMRDKLSNTANFGPSGTYSTSTMSFTVVGTPTTANLASNSCNIWFSGYDTGTAYGALSTFTANGGFVIGGCDSANNSAVCQGVGVTVTNYSNVGGAYTSALPINPLTCDVGSPNAGLNLTTAGGASSYFTSGETLARYSDANAFPLVIVDSNTTPSYVLTGDIDMFTTNNADITTGGNIVSDQDKFVANVFKLAADKVTGLLSGSSTPVCAPAPTGITAANDDFSGTNVAAGGTTPSVYTNDTLNGVVVSNGDVTPTITNVGGMTGVTINSNGTLTVPVGTSPGNYTITYQICDATDPAVCATATAIISVGTPPSGEYGDAPSDYGNPYVSDTSSGGSGFMRLGTTRNVETFNPNDDSATDDDGVIMPSLEQGQTVNIPITYSKLGGYRTYVNGWIDWNADGDFSDAGEQIATNLLSTAVTGSHNVSVTVPATASTNPTYARFRLSYNTPGISPTANETYGEIEDYAVTIIGTGTTIEAVKSVDVYDPLNAGLYFLPGNDVIYTFTIKNTGGAAADVDSIQLVDILPSEIEFWNGDIDAGGPNTYTGTDPVGFVEAAGTGMSLTYGTDVRFSTSATPPANFAACTVAVVDNTYRPDFTYICFNPKGGLGTGNPDPEIQVSFRARIK